ncbi:MAG: pirin family protein [Pseudomonadota bacterium]
MSKIVLRTAGHTRGGITRLVSPGDLGQQLRPFVFLDHFDIDGGGPQMGMHPHSGIATVSVVLGGALAFRDTTGQHGILQAGGVEWMSAAGGVWHTGGALQGGHVRGYQLWLALPPEDESAPAHSRYLAPEHVPGVGQARVIIGSYVGVQGPIQTRASINLLHVRLNDGERWTYKPPAGHDVAWLAAAKGIAQVDDAKVAQQIAVFDGVGAPIEVTARGDTEFLLGSAVRHPYPLVTGYYSVHTNVDALRRGEAEIERIGASARTLEPVF